MSSAANCLSLDFFFLAITFPFPFCVSMFVRGKSRGSKLFLVSFVLMRASGLGVHYSWCDNFKGTWTKKDEFVQSITWLIPCTVCLCFFPFDNGKFQFCHVPVIRMLPSLLCSTPNSLYQKKNTKPQRLIQQQRRQQSRDLRYSTLL